MTYQAYSGDQLSTAGIILIMPRPSDAKYLAFMARPSKDVRAKETVRDLPPMQLDALKAIDTYWDLIPQRGPQDAGRGRQGSTRSFTAGCATARPGSRSRVPEGEARGARRGRLSRGAGQGVPDAYHELEQAETQPPGQVAEPAAEEFFKASRSLGEAVASSYPTVAAIERETRFNAINPFWMAPFGYGAGLMLLVVAW